MTIHDLEREVRALVVQYVESLSPGINVTLRSFHVEASGDGVAMRYTNVEGDDAPTLAVTLTPTVRKR